MTPVNEMLLVPEEEARDLKLGRDGFRGNAARRDLVEGLKQNGALLSRVLVTRLSRTSPS